MESLIYSAFSVPTAPIVMGPSVISSPGDIGLLEKIFSSEIKESFESYRITEIKIFL